MRSSTFFARFPAPVERSHLSRVKLLSRMSSVSGQRNLSKPASCTMGETEPSRSAKSFRPHSQIKPATTSTNRRSKVIPFDLCSTALSVILKSEVRNAPVTVCRRDERPPTPDWSFVIGVANVGIDPNLTNAVVGAAGCNMSITAIRSCGLSPCRQAFTTICLLSPTAAARWGE